MNPIDEDDFESFDMMGLDDCDSPLNVDDLSVDCTLIPALTEACPNDNCSEDAAMVYAVELGVEFRQCTCGIYMLIEDGEGNQKRK